ncbi:hypothetical protein FACS1894171_1400 [Clostridia bacterium]|nr:hypothetical protein FACS1894171_1400 [Clostridia bacterium]
MITAILTMVIAWCLFYGRIPLEALVPLCLGLGIVLFVLGRHKHTQFFTIDVLAQASRLNRINPDLKFWTVLALIGVCVASPSPIVGVTLTVVMAVLTVWVGNLKPHDYVCLLALPVSFLMLSGLALLFEINTQSYGVISIPVFGFWLNVSPESQIRATLVMSRSLGAVSCLYLLSLTTPMSELIGVLRRIRCPDVLVELMYLIYRYIFMLLSMYYTMRGAAESRLGHANYRTSVRTTGQLYSNLLARSYQQAHKNFDAMESRCFDKEIRFLETKKRIYTAHAVAAAGLAALALSLALTLR